MAKTSSATGITVAAALAAFQTNPAMAPVTISDTTANVAKALDSLKPLAVAGVIQSIGLTDTATMPLPYAQYGADAAVIALLPARSLLVVQGLTVAQFLAAPADVRVKSFTVSDSSANILASLDKLNAAVAKLSAIAPTDTATMTLTYAKYAADAQALSLLPSSGVLIVQGGTAAQAVGEQANSRVKSFTVVDSAANVSAALNALNGDSKLTSVTLTDSAPIAMTYTQYTNDKTVLGKLPTSARYAVSAVAASKAATVAAASAVASLTVVDTAANVLSSLTALGPLTKLASIGLSGGTVLQIDYTRYQANTATLNKLIAADTLTVTGVPAANAAIVAAPTQVTHLTVADTLAHIGTSLDELQILASTGELTAIAVSDAGQTLTVTSAQYTADKAAIALLSGSFTIVQAGSPAPIQSASIFNLIWNPSVANAPAAFKTAVQYAAQYISSLIASPIVVNVEIGYGDVRGAALAPGLLGETYIGTGVSVSFNQLKADLTAHNTSAATQSALTSTVDPGTGAYYFLPGGQAKALGELAANATSLDASIGFASDPKGALFAYDPNNRAVAGLYDFVGLAEHELAHALGRVSYSALPTGLDLFRYSAPHVLQAAGATPSYFSVDGGVTNLGGFSTSGDLADWGGSMGNDASNAFLASGVVNQFSSADATLLNVLGFSMSTTAPALSAAAMTSGSVIGPSVGLGAAPMGFIAPEDAEAPALLAPRLDRSAFADRMPDDARALFGMGDSAPDPVVAANDPTRPSGVLAAMLACDHGQGIACIPQG